MSIGHLRSGIHGAVKTAVREKIRQIFPRNDRFGKIFPAMPLFSGYYSEDSIPLFICSDNRVIEKQEGDVEQGRGDANGELDLSRAHMPIGPIITGVVFLILQLVGLVWYFAQMDSRVSKMEFDIHSLTVRLEELSKEDNSTQLKALELSLGALREKVLNGRSRSADHVLMLQKEVEHVQYRLTNIEQSVDVQVH